MSACQKSVLSSGIRVMDSCEIDLEEVGNRIQWPEEPGEGYKESQSKRGVSWHKVQEDRRNNFKHWTAQ